MNIKDDKTYSLKVSDVQMLVTTYVPEYILFGVSTGEYTARPRKIDETLTTESEQNLPVCDFDSVLLYDEKADKFYHAIAFLFLPTSILYTKTADFHTYTSNRHIIFYQSESSLEIAYTPFPVCSIK